MAQTRFGKKDLIIILTMLFAGLLLFLFLILQGNESAMVKVTSDGNVVGTFPLNEDTSFSVLGGEAGSQNDVYIEEGQVYVTNSSCPDKLCEHMGKISKNGQSIVCLPNKLVVEIVSDRPEDQSQYDSIVK